MNSFNSLGIRNDQVIIAAVQFFPTEMLGRQVPAEVLPGQETEISVNLTAPQKAANYFANWRLTNASGIFFGQGLTVMIIVP